MWQYDRVDVPTKDASLDLASSARAASSRPRELHPHARPKYRSEDVIQVMLAFVDLEIHASPDMLVRPIAA